MTIRLGIIGYPLRHSLSSVFQQAALDYYGLDMTYDAWEVAPGSLKGFVEELRTLQAGILGCNVTVPHKEMAMAWLDEISPEARRVGAVNTIANQEGRLKGDNTDGYGFIRALREEDAFSAMEKRVLILGAGGAARAVAMGLVSEGVRSLTVANRTVERAKKLAKDLRHQGAAVDAISLRAKELGQAAEKADLIVNCTTLGMLHGSDEADSLLMAPDIPSHALVYDLVYNPPETPLLKEARKAGALVVRGLSMLIYQGAATFEMWTGKKAPLEVMFKAAREALKESSGE